MRLLSLTTAFVVCTSLTFAATIEVPIDQPTIQAGLDASLANDTVLVYDGTYTENIVMPGHDVVLASRYIITGDTNRIRFTIIDGDSSGPVISVNSGETVSCVIAGFTIRNGFTNDPDFGGGIYCNGAGPTISHNNIEQNTGYLGGGIHVSNGTPIIEHNLIRDNHSYFDSGSFTGWALGGGIYCLNAAATIDRNIIIANRGSAGGGVYCLHSNVVLTGSIIARCTSVVAGAGLFADSSAPQIDHTTIKDNVQYVFLESEGGLYFRESNGMVSNSVVCCNVGTQVGAEGTLLPTIRYSDIVGGYAGEGNVDVDPMMCDPAELDFYLHIDSPVRYAGEGGTYMGARDIGCTDCCLGTTGNVNLDTDDQVDVSDLSTLVNSLFLTFEPLPCPAEANINGDPNCDIDITDLTGLVNYLYITMEPLPRCDDACEP
jgi:hypothetical protein